MIFPGNHLLYDAGTSGLMMAALMNAIGSNTTGHLIHMHPGNECQKNAFLAMQFPPEQSNRCINVNIYSVLRYYYQNKSCPMGQQEELITKELNKSFDEKDSTPITEQTNNIEVLQDKSDDSDAEPSSKKIKLENSIHKKSWQLDNEKACKFLANKVDSLIITAKEHPVAIVTELLPLLNANRNLIVFNLLREPLQDLFVYLKNHTDIVNIRFMNTFVRNYQVLPGRTHPEVNMTNGGYILTATKVHC